jgi:hypothetical protein
LSYNTEFSGKCPKCNREYHSKHGDAVVCVCWEICPECGEVMETYMPDLSAHSYGLDGKRDLQVLKVCNNSVGHSDRSPYFSIQRPIEVELRNENY